MGSALKAETGHITLDGERVAFSLIRSRKRRRTINFKVEADTSLKVLAPYAASLGKIARILQKRKSWIMHERVERKSLTLHDYSDGGFISYLGHTYKLRITQGADFPLSCKLSPHSLHIHIPNENLSESDLRAEIKLEFSLWLKKRARLLLKKRLDLWAQKLGVTYKRFTLSNAGHRWGSCSAENVIRLNWLLLMAPLSIVDYVAAHELSHVRHKNHSKQFWHFLEQAMPDYKMRRKRMRGLEGKLSNF